MISFKKRFRFRRGRTDHEDAVEVEDSSLADGRTQHRNDGFPKSGTSQTTSGAPLHSASESLQLRPMESSTIAKSITEVPDQEPIGLRSKDLDEARGCRDFLALEVPPARTTFGRRPDLDVWVPCKLSSREPKDEDGFLRLCKNLLYDLRYATDDEAPVSQDLRMGERPIIFVAHSMGGLIVKEAYIQGQSDPVFGEIIEAVSSIIFLSTPHRGTNLAATLNRILQVNPSTNPMEFIQELSTGSQTLQRLNDQFRHVAHRLEIISFYETRPTKVFKKAKIMVLETDSSILGYPGEVSNPLDADHVSICKYENRSDPNYIAVRNALKRMISDNCGKGKWQASTAVKEKLDLAWAPDRDSYNNWFEDTFNGPRVLWVRGNAACGKSTLASFVIDNLTKLGCSCQYFFVRFGDKDKCSVSTMLRSLASQLAMSLPEYAEKLRQLAGASPDLKTADHRMVWQWLFKHSLLSLHLGKPIYWVIDGIDEADCSEIFLKLLTEFSSTTLPIRILIFSRRTQDLSFCFERLETHISVATIHTEGNDDDFRHYIKQELNVAAEESFKSELLSQILERSQGNFLWIHLAAERIRKCRTKAHIENALRDLPLGMEALYDRMASTVQNQSDQSYRELALSVLGWASCAQRRLGVRELADALGNPDLLDFDGTIVELCGGFIVIDKEGQVSLVHETAREYLVRESAGDHTTVIDERATHDNLYRTCLERLTDPMLRSQISRDQLPPLLVYAAETWGYHFSQGHSTSTDMLDAVVGFSSGQSVLTWINVMTANKQLSSLVTAARYLKDVARKIRQLSDESFAPRRKEFKALTGWAADIVKIVGKINDLQQFGEKESQTLRVSGIDRNTWDNCLACFPLEEGAVSKSVHTAGQRILVSANKEKSGHVFVYDSSTFEEEMILVHPERLFRIQIDRRAERLVTYGYRTTRVWSLNTGECLKSVANPAKRPRPLTLMFSEIENAIVLGCDDQRIYRLRLDDATDDSSWEAEVQFDMQLSDNTISNGPICSSLKPDGSMIAYGYHLCPITVWQLPLKEHVPTEPHVEQCNIALQSDYLAEIVELLWHPFDLELIGLTRVGQLFKWNIYDEEPSATINTHAHHIANSQNGLLVATGDAFGIIEVSDSGRIYDVRLQHGTVWEPNNVLTLVDISYTLGGAGNSAVATESVSKKVFAPIGENSRHGLKVTALAVQSTGPLYCYGTENGVTYLCEVGCGKIGDLQLLHSNMCIEQMAWSKDGNLAAAVDLAGRLSVERIAKKSTTLKVTWWSREELRVVLPPEHGHVSQLFFHPDNGCLFASTSTVLYVIDITTSVVKTHILAIERTSVRWICHPQLPDYVLGFGNTSICVFAWDGLHEMSSWQMYSPPREAKPVILSSSPPHPSLGNAEALNRIIYHSDSPDIILQITDSTAGGRFKSEHLVFSVADICNLARGESATTKDLPYTLIPKDVSSRIREPLAFLPRKGLVFLDQDRWICTWRPHSGVIENPQSSGADQSGVESHYFLPGDWKTANKVKLYDSSQEPFSSFNLFITTPSTLSSQHLQNPINQSTLPTNEHKMSDDNTSSLVDTTEKVWHLINTMRNLNLRDANKPALYIDIEGVNLGRYGTVSIVTMYVAPLRHTYLLDVQKLQLAAFAPPGPGEYSLKAVLESPDIVKCFFDVRNDSDALFSLYGIRLQGILDVQLMENVKWDKTRQTHLMGLEKCIDIYAPISPAAKTQWSEIKQLGRRLFNPSQGGSFEVFNERPLTAEIERYCTNDVTLLPLLRETLLVDMSEHWWLRVLQESANRVTESQGVHFNPQGRWKSLGPFW
ncbi:hypothetical protein G7046_g7383 [Stylonectria norvegica]|nr:hypothetical protein G7046_g7383 [Stylonectria norvegica]